MCYATKKRLSKLNSSRANCESVYLRALACCEPFKLGTDKLALRAIIHPFSEVVVVVVEVVVV